MTRLRDLERDSIRAYVERHADKLTGDVLDFGAGRQPYRDIVEQAGGSYHPFDRGGYPGALAGVGNLGDDWPFFTIGRWDAILCNQVVQFIPDVPDMALYWRHGLKGGGWLVLTGPTNWPVVEEDDLHRFTTSGIRRLLEQAGFDAVECEYRAHVSFEGERWPIGWGVLARAT